MNQDQMRKDAEDKVKEIKNELDKLMKEKEPRFMILLCEFDLKAVNSDEKIGAVTAGGLCTREEVIEGIFTLLESDDMLKKIFDKYYVMKRVGEIEAMMNKGTSH